MSLYKLHHNTLYCGVFHYLDIFYGSMIFCFSHSNRICMMEFYCSILFCSKDHKIVWLNIHSLSIYCFAINFELQQNWILLID